MDFKKYIHAVGTGKKGNRDLSFDESKDMMSQILEQNIPNEQIAAFLLGWRLKPETVEEFQGAISTFDNYIQKTKLSNSIELGYPFDGKANNPYLFPLIANVLQKSNLNLVVNGDDLIPAKKGITIKDICSNTSLPQNTHYFDRSHYFKELHNLTQVRNHLGLRTGFSTIEKLPQVANSEFAITGIYHKPYVQKYVDVFASRYKRFALIQGNEGTPELFSKGRLWLANSNDIQEYIIDPHRYGINYTRSWENITLEESLEQLHNPSKELLKLAHLNGAIYLFITQDVESIDEGYEKLNG